MIGAALVAFLVGRASVGPSPEVAPESPPPVAAPFVDPASSPGAPISPPNSPSRLDVAPIVVAAPTPVAESTAPVSRPTSTPTPAPTPPPVAETVAVSAQTAAEGDVVELSIDSLIAQTRAPAWKDRWDAVIELEKRKDMRAIPALAERALTDDNPHPRWRSRWALGSVDRSATTVKPLLLAGLDDPDAVVVRNAAVALSFLGFEEARPELLNGLGDPDDCRRWEAVFCIKWTPGPEVVSALVRMVDPANEPAERVRSEAALSLGRIGSEVSVTPLLTALDTDPQPPKSADAPRWPFPGWAKSISSSGSS